MKVLDCELYKIVLLYEDSDHDYILETYPENELIYVPMDGVQSDVLSPDRFLVKNHESSFFNHMQWEGLLDEDEQTEYIFSRCRKFYETGKQMVIEDYDFVEDEPFYDYSK